MDNINNNKIYGVEVGEVVEIEKDSSRVKVKFDSLSEQHNSNWAQVSTFMTGSGMGAYFIPNVHDKVLVAFHQGNKNEPFIIGSIWTSEQKPPETKENTASEVNKDGKNNLRYIKSKSGHLIILDDTEGKEKIQIIDKTGKNRIEIKTGENAEDNVIDIINGEGNINLKAINGKVNVECSDFQVKSSKTTNLVAGEAMEIKSTKEMKITSAAGIKSKAKNIENKADSNVKYEVGSALEVKSGEINIESSGNLTSKAGGIQEIKGMQVKIN